MRMSSVDIIWRLGVFHVLQEVLFKSRKTTKSLKFSPFLGRARDNEKEKEQQQQRQRRHSNSYDESELVKRIENDFDTAQSEYAQQHKSLYSRLAANAYKYQYLHKVCFFLLSCFKCYQMSILMSGNIYFETFLTVEWKIRV
jgi:hypothetical protein